MSKQLYLTLCKNYNNYSNVLFAMEHEDVKHRNCYSKDGPNYIIQESGVVVPNSAQRDERTKHRYRLFKTESGRVFRMFSDCSLVEVIS